MSEEPKEENKGLISWFISLFTGEEKGEGKEEDVVIYLNKMSRIKRKAKKDEEE